MKNTFSDCAQKLTNSDIGELERQVKIDLPVEFKNHYLRNNGGSPDLDWVPGNSNWEPTRLQEFLPIFAAGMDEELQQNCIYSHYIGMLEKKVITAEFLPFAVDPGGNFYSINLKSGWVFYMVTEIGGGLRKVSNNFKEFLKSLTDEDSAYG